MRGFAVFFFLYKNRGMGSKGKAFGKKIIENKKTCSAIRKLKAQLHLHETHQNNSGAKGRWD